MDVEKYLSEVEKLLSEDKARPLGPRASARMRNLARARILGDGPSGRRSTRGPSFGSNADRRRTTGAAALGMKLFPVQ